jgi:arsenite-transporting ATPase
MIETPMQQYMTQNPKLKYIFFGGKGGVGKTVMAGAAAIWEAQQGKKTLLASTNPVHSLSSLLGQDVFGKPTPVEGVPNLTAYEIDTKDTIEKSKKEIREKIAWCSSLPISRPRQTNLSKISHHEPGFRRNQPCSRT